MCAQTKVYCFCNAPIYWNDNPISVNSDWDNWRWIAMNPDGTKHICDPNIKIVKPKFERNKDSSKRYRGPSKFAKKEGMWEGKYGSRA